MAIFGPKQWVNPFGKVSIFRLFELLVFIAQRGVYSFQNIVRDIFLAYIAKKKKVGKMAILDRNHGLTPLEKCQFFDFFKLLVFIAQKGVYSFQNSVKHIFLAYIAQKKKLEKWLFLDQNHGLTLLEKCYFFAFLNFLFLQPRKAFIRSRIS